VAHRRYLADRGDDGRFIARGPLLSDDGTEWVGSAWLVEIHHWQFGGRSAD
jgi:uncharacterized protein YciI